MIRAATENSLAALCDAARASDRELDRALSDVGILPPLELGPLRRVLGRRGIQLASRLNDDGHCVIDARWVDGAAVINPDGTVGVLNSSTAA